MLNGLSDNGDIKTYVDGEKVDNVLLTGVPIPRMDTKMATLVYYTILENKGQQIIDIAAHTENEIHEYKIAIDDAYAWIYDGKILRYRVLEDDFLGVEVEIKLCGKFKYIRGGKLSSEIDFSEIKS